LHCGIVAAAEFCCPIKNCNDGKRQKIESFLYICTHFIEGGYNSNLPWGPLHSPNIDESYGGLQDKTAKSMISEPLKRTGEGKFLCQNCLRKMCTPVLHDPECSDCLTREAINSARAFERRQELEKWSQAQAKKLKQDCQNKHGVVQRLGKIWP
jgi:hypothetical protein